MSPLRDKLLEFQKSVNRAVSNDLYGNEFCKLSSKGNRRGMIEMLMKLPEIKNFVIENYYLGKDNDVAKKLYKKALTLNEYTERNRKTTFLTQSLFASSYKSTTFLNILLELTRNWYKLGKFQKCLKSCKYFESLENFSCEISVLEEFRIEFLLIESECYKRMDLAENCKVCLNEAMKKVNELIENKRENQDFKTEKISFLKPIFERLNSMRMSTETNTTIEKIDNFLQKDRKIPKLEGKINDKLKSCSDAITLGSNEAKGRFLFATRRIKTGSVLIVDRPFAFSTDQEALERNCFHCHTSLKLEDNIRVPCNNCQRVSYCSEICHKESWEKYHKFECNVLNYFFSFDCSLLGYRTTLLKAINKSNSIDSEFVQYHSQETSSKIGSEIYDPLDYRTVFSLETHCTEFDPKDNFQLAFRSIFLAKLLKFVLSDIKPELSIDQEEIILLAVGTFRHLQAIGCNAYEIVENVRNQTTKVIEPRNIGGAIYTSVSLTNHSCYPNVIRHSYQGGTVVVTALRTIEKGSEILDCYGPHFISDKKKLRRDQLMKKYYFSCKCQACSLDWKMPLSDKIEFKCSCSDSNPSSNSQKCLKCSDKIDCKKICRRLEESKKKNLSAISKMYDGNYTEALPILIDHSNLIENYLIEPSLESIKTQQSIIQCLNSMSCTSVE